MKKILFLLVSLILIFFLGKNLLPSNKAFDYHDSSQPARVQQFVFDLRNGQIPPRIAPDFSFKLGFPVFNYYAPTAYWITSFINILGIDPINAIKISFLLALFVAFIGTYLLGNELIGYPAGLIAGALLAASPWSAVQIFIRGDLAEAWFIALFPLTLYLLKKNAEKNSRLLFVVTVLIVSSLLTVHNILSLISSGLIVIYVLIVKRSWKKNLLTIFLGLLLSAYFLVPALTEIKNTHAIDIASHTNYYDSFLCLGQLWTGAWGYGGSVAGCTGDGMSFMLGKLMIIMAISGTIIGFINYKKIRNKFIFIFLVALSSLSAFMTVYQSNFIWIIGKPILKLFQFPWRFSDIAIIGLATLAGYNLFATKKIYIKILLVILVIFNIFYNAKFFTKYPIPLSKFTQDVLSTDYIDRSVAYKVAEYLPKTVDYKDWLKFEPQKDVPYKTDPYVMTGPVFSNSRLPVEIVRDAAFDKEANTLMSGQYLINIHYLPYWKIYLNGKAFEPKKFDSLGRPILDLKSPTMVKVTYQQTPIESFADFISLLTIMALIGLSSSKSIWKKKTILNL